MKPSTSHDPGELLEHADFLRALARGLLGDAARADDVVQDAYLAALERPPVTLDARGALRSWLGKVVRKSRSTCAAESSGGRSASTRRRGASPPLRTRRYVLGVATDSGLEVRGEFEIESLEPLPEPLRFALR